MSKESYRYIIDEHPTCVTDLLFFVPALLQMLQRFALLNENNQGNFVRHSPRYIRFLST